MNVYVDTPNNAERFSAALHRAGVSNVVSIRPDENINKVKILDNIEENKKAMKVIHRYIDVFIQRVWDKEE